MISNHFDPRYYIQIKMDVSSYTIGGILNQLISNDLGQWYIMVFFSRKMILAKTWYKTYNNKLLAIIRAFKT